MDPVSIGMLALGGLNMLQNMDKERRQTKLAATTQRYSPWTGLRANQIDYANPAGDLAQAGAGVLGYQQAQESAALRKQLTEAQIRALDRGTLSSTSSPMMNSGGTNNSPWTAIMNSRMGTPYSY